MVEGLAIAVVVFGPLLVFLVLLLKAIRKLMPQPPIEVPSWKPRGSEQPRVAETWLATVNPGGR